MKESRRRLVERGSEEVRLFLLMYDLRASRDMLAAYEVIQEAVR